MTALEIGIASFPVLLLLIFLRFPIGLVMLLCGLGGTILITGDTVIILAKLKTEIYSTFSSYSLSIIPIFLLMGHFAARGGISNALFRAAEAWLGHKRGGVAMAAIGACAGFGAICGSSLATAATMGQIALPELKRHGYSGGLATATLAAGGTLGILIPPSVLLVIYAILSEQNIAKLFLTAFIPGVMAALGYMLVISLYVRFYPESAGSCPPVPYAERLSALVKIWPVVLIFALVVGGIYFGWFTPTEGASIGAMGTALIAWLNGGLNRHNFIESILSTAVATAMIFFIIMGAAFYNSFLALTQVPQELALMVTSQGFSPWLILILILLIYLLLGCVMDSLSMILLTIPIFFPILIALDFGMTVEETAIWFGILVLIVVEVGLITPPVGMNLFVINTLDRETPLIETYRAVIPFVLSDLVRVALLILFPGICLFLL